MGMGRILVVDDIPELADVIRSILVMDGHDVRTCHSGREAITALQEESYDLMIADIVMPEQDGLELSRYVREEMPEDRRHIPILAMSGGCSAIPARIALAAAGQHATDILYKPFDDVEVITAVRKALAA
jgi:CheY-like chemotaxis protein